MNGPFREYFERYNDDKYVFATYEFNIIVGTILPKTRIFERNNTKAVYAINVVDIVNKIDIFEEINECGVFKKGELTENDHRQFKNKIIIFDNYKDAFYDNLGLYITYANPRNKLSWGYNDRYRKQKEIECLDDSIIELDFSKLHVHLHFIDISNILPRKLLHLTLDRSYDHPLYNLPPKLTHMTFGNQYNKVLVNIPKSLKYIKFGAKFNQPLDQLPSGLETIIFGYNFNMPVDDLPPNIRYIEFGDTFDRPIDKLPKKIKEIVFGMNFSHPIDKLPDTIETITFRNNYNKSVRKWPKALTTVILREKKKAVAKYIPKHINIEYKKFLPVML